MSDIQTWSTTAASNNATPPNGFPEGMAPSTVNDAAREVMAAVARYRSDTDGVNTSAGTNIITLAASRTMTAYAQGDMYTFKAGGTNTGATTLNVDSLGAKDVQFNGAACTGGEIVSGLMYTVVYDGTQFQLMNASSYPAIDITSLEVTNIKAKDGTASITLANSTGVATINSAVLTTADINGGTIDNSVIGATTPVAGSFTNINLAGEYPLGGIVESRTISTTRTAAFSYSTAGITMTGAGSLINQYGYRAIDLTQATNLNIGFYAEIDASTGSDLRYQFYADGTAPNYFNGATTFNSAVSFSETSTFSKNTIVSVTDNTNAALRVTQLGTANALEIEDSTNPDATPFIVDASGRLIQGFTTAVASKILTTATTPAWQAHGTQAGTFSWTNNATFPGFFLFNKSKSGVVGALSAVTDGDNLGIIQFNGADNDATPTFNPAAYISAQVAGTVASTSIPGRLNFATTASGGTSPSVIVQIASTGLTVIRDAAGLGYGTGSGGAVTQATSRTTGVTLNKTNGAITLVSAAGTATWQSFTVTNSTVAATDVVVLSQRSGTDLYMLEVTAVAAGSFRISFATTGGTTTEQPVFNFAVIKAVAA